MGIRATLQDTGAARGGAVYFVPAVITALC